MALGSDVVLLYGSSGFVSSNVGLLTDWQACHTNPDAIESSTGVIATGKVVKPGAIDTPDYHLVSVPYSTTVMLALKYNSDVGTPTSPIVRVFARDRNGEFHVLSDVDGNDELTITVALSTDTVSTDGTYKITKPIEVDLDGSEKLIVGIQTAFAAGSGTATDSEVLVKPK